MITVYSGTPGAGKSYSAVKTIIDNLRLGRTIYTNVEGLDIPECKRMIQTVTGLDDYEIGTRLNFMSYHHVPEFWKHVKGGALIVLDELQKVFSNREWQTEKNKEFSSWASTHRHHGFDLIIITQSVERIDAAVRALVEWTYVFRKVNFFGSFVKNSFLCYSYAGDDCGGKPVCPPQRRVYDRRIFDCYNSYIAKDVKEVAYQKHANVLRHPIFYAIPLVTGLFIWQLSHSSLVTGHFLGVKKPAPISAPILQNKPMPSMLPPGIPLQAVSASVSEPKLAKVLANPLPVFPVEKTESKPEEPKQPDYTNYDYTRRECEKFMKTCAGESCVEGYQCSSGVKLTFLNKQFDEWLVMPPPAAHVRIVPVPVAPAPAPVEPDNLKSNSKPDETTAAGGTLDNGHRQISR